MLQIGRAAEALLGINRVITTNSPICVERDPQESSVAPAR